MKNLLLISLLIIFLYSCKKETSYRMQILIENVTDNKLTVTLYPKTKYLKSDLYNYSELGNGDYVDTSFDLESTDYRCLFISVSLDQEPYDLATKIFDSIIIKPNNENIIDLKFSNDTVIGYSENLFNEESTWKYENKNYSERTNFSRQPIESNDYSFVISTDKY